MFNSKSYGTLRWLLFPCLVLYFGLLGCSTPPKAVTKLSPIDGKVMVRIPAGEFRIGTSAEQQTLLASLTGVRVGSLKDEAPQAALVLPEFYMDQTPVTNAEYKKFLDANLAQNVPYVDDILVRAYDWDKTSRTFPAGQANLPVVLATWNDAMAYCRWAGGRLPTEAEWEKAARGTDGRIWPWGNDWDESKIYPGEPSTRLPQVGQSPAGASPYGALDMVGIIWQWTSSLDKPYPYKPDDGREDAGAPGLRVTRGGAWDFGTKVVRTTTRNAFDPAGASLSIGFRCAQ